MRRSVVLLALLASGLLAVSAAASPTGGTTNVKVSAISLTYRVTMTIADTSGKRTLTLRADLTGGGTGPARPVEFPPRAGYYACDTNCAAYTIGGTVTIEDTLVPPAGKGPRVSCKKSKTFARGAKEVMPPSANGFMTAFSAPTAAAYRIEVTGIPSVAALIAAVRPPTCKLPNVNYGERLVTIEGKTPVASLKQAKASITLAGAPVVEVPGGTGTASLKGKLVLAKG